jgi:hypothetical protein
LAKEREPYRQDVRDDGKGIERTGWFHTEADEKTKDPEYAAHENIVSRLCALDWIVLLFEYVVPDVLKDEVSRHAILCFKLYQSLTNLILSSEVC